MIVRIASPAKVNLGLEILGRRDDGFHEMRSVLAMIDLCDELTFTPTDVPQSRVRGMPDIPTGSNLIVKAIRAFNDATGDRTAWDVAVSKRIPAPSGLGGASSNAASTLLALNHAAGFPIDRQHLHALGASLGSDVPFFLDEPAALVSGTGTDLEPVPAPAGWILVVAPRTDLSAKTATLYGALTYSDYSGGATIDQVVSALERGSFPGPGLLANAFSRPLEQLVPETRILRETMLAVGISDVALTGAGPAHYAHFPDQISATEMRSRLESTLPIDADMFVAPLRQDRITILSM